MRKITRISLALGTSAALLSLSALPASADDVLENDATIVVDSAGLFITVPDRDVPLTTTVGKGSEFDSELNRTASISVPGVSVADYRAGAAGWTLQITLSDFTAEDVAPIKAAGAEYDLGSIRSVGEIGGLPVNVILAGTEDGVAAGSFVPTVTGSTTASWDATVKVGVPSKALAKKYSAVLTHSLMG